MTRRRARRTGDAAVVGSGPNGFAAAITLAAAGYRVTIHEAADEAGGGARSGQLTIPGFTHDLCSAVFPFGRDSPFFRSVGLETHGLRWVEPPVPFGHPLDGQDAVLAERDLEATARALGPDRDAYRRLIGPLVEHWDSLLPDILAPFHVPLDPRRALRLARFGLDATRSAVGVARRFRSPRTRALWAGAAAHAILPLDEPLSAAAGLVMLASAHAGGWPIPVGGAGSLTAALEAELARLGGIVRTGHLVRTLDDVGSADLVLLDVAPRAVASIAGPRLPTTFRRRLRAFRHGPGSFKLDIALDGVVPWRVPRLGGAGVVHVGGELDEIAAAEAAPHRGHASRHPFVLVVQPSIVDPGRAPAGRSVVWAYCHVPNGSGEDASGAILAQIERHAPGFRDRVLAMEATPPAELERRNPNDVGGDIGGGRFDLRQLFTRPSLRVLDPYSTPDSRIFICSASTPPGGGVHGMCGYLAATSALRRTGDS